LPLRDANGKVKGIIGVNHDITQLRQAEARLEQVIRSARCLLWTASVTRTSVETEMLEWEYKIVNEAAAQGFLRLNNTSTYTAAWLEAIPMSEKVRRDNMLTSAIRSDQTDYHLEYYMILNNNETHWLSEDVIIQQ